MKRLALIGLLAFAAIPAEAQTDARLAGAVELAQEGHGDSARKVAQRVLGSVPTTDPLYVEALYTSARVSNDADEMRRTLQRITVEHALSPWADDALLALAELDYAGGNVPATRRTLDRFRSDYPSSPLFARASFWAARAAFDARDERKGCEWVGMGLARVPDDDPETRGQLDFFARRCNAAELSKASAIAPPPETSRGAVQPPSSQSSAETVSVDTSRRAAEPPSPPAAEAPRTDTIRAVVAPPASDTSRRAAPTPGSGQAQPPSSDSTRQAVSADTSRRAIQPPSRPYRVQIVAAPNASAANAAVAKAKSLGFDAIVVQEGGFFKVRAGTFGSRADAQGAAARLDGSFPGAFPVRDP